MPFLDKKPEIRRPAPGVELVCLPDERFKRALVLFHFDRPLDERSPARTLLCRVLEQGSAAYPSRMELSRVLESLYGAAMEVDGNKLAEMHRVTLAVTWVGGRFLPADNTVARDALALGREVLENPLRGQDGAPFSMEIFQRERDQLVRHIRSLVDDRSAYAEERFFAEMCAGEPYGRPPYGDEATVSALDAAALEEARVDLLERATVTVLALGPVDANTLEEAVREWLGAPGLEAAREAPPAPVPKRPDELRSVRETIEVDQARFLMGFRIPPPRTAAELERLSLANAVFGSGTSSRLFREVREERSLAYGIYSTIRSVKGLLVVEAGIDAGSFEEVRDQVLAQVADLAGGGATADELAVAKAAVMNDLNAIGDTARGLANFFTRERLVGLNRTPAQRAAELQSVQLEELAGAAAQWQPDLVYLLAPEKALVEAT